MVCHLSNPKVRSFLPLKNGARFNWTKTALGINLVKRIYSDYAGWNDDLAEFIGTRNDVAFTIIAPHSGMKKKRVEFVLNNVNYVFLDPSWSFHLKHFVRNRTIWRKINPLSKSVKKEIIRINPDLVVLMGTENSYYSCTVLDIKDYPVYAMCQTVYNNPSRKDYGMWNVDNSETELCLFKEIKYFGVYCRMHYELVRKYSPYSHIFKFAFPKRSKLLEPIPTVREYDFVNFAMRMDSRKGFPDAIQALSIVKKKYNDVKLNLIGQCSKEQKQELESLIFNLGLQNNVVFTPYFEKQSDMFLHIQKSRFAVLPCKVDDISGTMMQSMQLGLPIIVYRTTGTPSFNKQKQCALIAEKENVEELAQHMMSLMEDPKLAESLRINGREWQEKKYEESLHNGDHIIDNFKAIIGHFRNGTSIPQEQLFNPDKDN